MEKKVEKWLLLKFLLWCSRLRISVVSAVFLVTAGPAQWVKDPDLLQLWHRSALWLRFHPWPRNSRMLQVQGKKKKVLLLMILDGRLFTLDPKSVESPEVCEEEHVYLTRSGKSVR